MPNSEMARKSIDASSSKRQRVESSPPRWSSGSDSSSDINFPQHFPIAQKDKYREVVEKKIIKRHCVIDWGVLGEYDLKPAFQRMIGDGPWAKLFNIREPAYRQTTLAFLATFKIKFENLAATMSNEVEFFAFGRMHRIDMFDFVRAMGLYTREEMDDEDFEDLPTALPMGVSANSFWREIANESKFRPSKSKASLLKTTSARVFHYILVRTIHGKLESPGAVGEHDILPLYSVMRGYPINVGVIAAFGIRRQTFEKSCGVFVGGLITKILKGLGLWPTRDAPRDSCADPDPLSRAPFCQWGINPVQDPKLDIEAPGTQEPEHSQGSFFVGNLRRLEDQLYEIMQSQRELQAGQRRIEETQKVIVEFLKNIAAKIGASIPACFCGIPTPTEAGPSHSPAPPPRQPKPH